ncbi:MAG: site-specific integrase [Peptococcaceae bacterium]|nr:site-specific integrase [Peptococcaceae bacterium]
MANLMVLDKGTKKERYKVMYDVPTLPGQKRKRESKTFPAGTPKREVMQFKKKVEADVLTMSPTNNHDLTFAEAADIFFKYYSLNLETSTMSGYMSIYNREDGLKAYFGKMKLKQIDTNTVQMYIAHLHSIGKSQKTISNMIGLFSTIMKQCIHLQYIHRNPVEGTILPKKQVNLDVQAYTAEQVQILLNLSKDKPLVYTTIALGTLAGLRRGEMAALTWDDVVLDKSPYITINKTRFQVSKNLGFAESTGEKTPKTNAGIRTIPIPDVLAEILRKQKHRYNLCKIRYGKDFVDSNRVLFKEDGSEYAVCTISSRYTEFMKEQTVVPYYSLHKLRHTFASILASINTPVKDVQEMLGHSDIKTTMSVYTHGFEASKRTAVAELNRLISM